MRTTFQRGFLAAATVLAACGPAQQTTTGSGATTKASPSPDKAAGNVVDHGDKKANYLSASGREEPDGIVQDGDGTKLVFNEVVLKSPGFITVNAGTSRVAVSPLLQAGPHKNVEVVLNPPFTQRRKVIAVLYLDTNNDTQFESPPDEPAKFISEESGESVVEIGLYVGVGSTGGSSPAPSPASSPTYAPGY
jgi:hypothetical protein